ncbi:hypothetical protein PILCRDRAFT_3679 [Piloderma croceum F 1598]|uniref:Uncharacterized protein n=1 Tax=Piloderma croceum (strain F 1598) TaxID=765440 RepID=A0A0C3FUB0_PILCF|nr:hypothetical protein PILCRDRAFT_3679 [Piloderma croceum F 1598]
MDVPARLPVAVIEPMWFVHRAVGLHVVIGLVLELSVLVGLISLVFELLELACYLLVSLDLSFVSYFPVSSYFVAVLFELLKLLCLVFGLPVPVFELPGDMPAMSIWSGTNTNTTTRSNKCELASNPSKSDKISSVMQSRCLDVDHNVSM